MSEGRRIAQRDKQRLGAILLAEGYTQQEAGKVVHRSARTVRRWLWQWRHDPEAFNMEVKNN
uniref:Putative DNA binding, helix-turn-helix domain containing protein n=1 Tax=viral metagenome TaxID=1070528 RepID=A0A6M3LEV0_9ZZZZ